MRRKGFHLNVFIFSDLEGIPEIYDIKDIEFGTERYTDAMDLLSKWLNITGDACFAAGADRVYFLDGHAGPGRCNINYDMLDSRLIELHEAQEEPGWDALVKSGDRDCIIELGSHARAGTLGGFLDHTTNSRKFFCHTVGGREFSELALHAAYAGAHGVPTVLCIGDLAACLQAKEYIPEIVTVAVKEAQERNMCSPLGNPEEEIRAGVREALSKISQIKPMIISLPTEVALTYLRSDFLEENLKVCHGEDPRKAARTLSRIIDNLENYENLYFT